MEWEKDQTLRGKVRRMLQNEMDVTTFLSADPKICISDDRPYNEYFLLHQAAAKNHGTFRIIR